MTWKTLYFMSLYSDNIDYRLNFFSYLLPMFLPKWNRILQKKDGQVFIRHKTAQTRYSFQRICLNYSQSESAIPDRAFKIFPFWYWAKNYNVCSLSLQASFVRSLLFRSIYSRYAYCSVGTRFRSWPVYMYLIRALAIHCSLLNAKHESYGILQFEYIFRFSSTTWQSWSFTRSLWNKRKSWRTIICVISVFSFGFYFMRKIQK